MKLAVLVLALAALVAPLAVVGDVPVPYDNCGASTDHFKVSSAMASVWPPVPGQPVTLTLAGSLDEPLQGGSYVLAVEFDGFPIVNQQGSLADLGKITWPIPAGPVSIIKTLTVPSVIPASSQIIVNASALDSNGQEIICIGMSIIVPADASTQVDPEEEFLAQGELPVEIDERLIATDSNAASQLFNIVEEVATQKVSLKQVVAELLHIASGEMEVIANKLAGEVEANDAPVAVPYTNCGASGDLITITNITSTVWPPQLGATAALSINFVANQQIADGTYKAVVSVDGFPLITKSGDISKYFKVPIAAGPVTINKNIKLPSSLPFSGSIGIQLSGDDENDNELFCLDLSFSI